MNFFECQCGGCDVFVIGDVFYFDYVGGGVIECYEIDVCYIGWFDQVVQGGVDG